MNVKSSLETDQLCTTGILDLSLNVDVSIYEGPQDKGHVWQVDSHGSIRILVSIGSCVQRERARLASREEWGLTHFRREQSKQCLCIILT